MPYGDMAIIAMRGCEEFASKVDYYLLQWRGMPDEHTYVINAQCPRFGTGEAKGLIDHTARGLDVFIIFRTGLIYGEKKPPAPPQAQHMPIHFAAEAISKPEP